MAVAHHTEAALAGGYILTLQDYKYLQDNGLTDLIYWMRRNQEATAQRQIVEQIRTFNTLLAAKMMQHPQTAIAGKRYLADLHQQLAKKTLKATPALKAQAWGQQQSLVATLLPIKKVKIK